MRFCNKSTGKFPAPVINLVAGRLYILSPNSDYYNVQSNDEVYIFSKVQSKDNARSAGTMINLKAGTFRTAYNTHTSEYIDVTHKYCVSKS